MSIDTQDLITIQEQMVRCVFQKALLLKILVTFLVTNAAFLSRFLEMMLLMRYQKFW